MRYEDWDILLFPEDRRIPLKEFKVGCHVVHDNEFSHTHGSIGVPTVCCFVPSLPAGEPFQVSIHSWINKPAPSQFAKSFTDFPDIVKFEARLFIDGRLVATTCLDPVLTWPHLIAHSFDFSKNGDLEVLRFPAFKHELLQQSHWSPADNIGRIKVVISEGFPRDSLTMPLERVKNVVAFSFQHAPLDILEAAAIAWPNPSMWRRQPHTATGAQPTYNAGEGSSHAHSPRRDATGQGDFNRPLWQPLASRNGHGSNLAPQSIPAVDGNIGYPSCGENSSFDMYNRFDWLGNADVFGPTTNMSQPFGPHAVRNARKSSTDTSMPDYVPNGGEKTGLMDPSFEMRRIEEQVGADEEGNIGSTKVPANTPTESKAVSGALESTQFTLFPHAASIPPDLALALTNSLLNQPAPLKGHQHTEKLPATEIKSRKEARSSQAGPSPSTTSSTSTYKTETYDIHQQARNLTGSSIPTGTIASHVGTPHLFLSTKGLETGQSIASPVELVPVGVNEGPAEGALRIISGNSEKGTKRARNFTPLSGKVFDGEDEPRRSSPKIRLASFVETTELTQDQAQ